MIECNDCVHYLICSHYKDHRHECSFFMNDKNTVEVVRCKDCKHSEPSVNAIGEPSCCCNNSDIGFFEWLMGEDDFCSYGERREGE